MKVPDAIEPAMGYRVWLVRNGYLHSLNHEAKWQPNVPFEAVCSREHDVPDPKCSCGCYAALTFNRLFDMGYTKQDGLFSAPGEITIAGQVNMWGGIIPGQIGWRGQFAYPKKLLVPYSLWEFARPLADMYGVPFSLYNLERKHGLKGQPFIRP
jgi:hypothetical protein